MLAIVRPVAGKYNNQFAIEKPVRKMPPHKRAPIRANHIRIDAGAFMIN
jgi:hypothetical protein